MAIQTHVLRMSKRKAAAPEPNIELLPEIWDLIWKQVPLLRIVDKYESGVLQVWEVIDHFMNFRDIPQPLGEFVLKRYFMYLDTVEWLQKISHSYGPGLSWPNSKRIISWIRSDIVEEDYGPITPLIVRRCSLKEIDLTEEDVTIGMEAQIDLVDSFDSDDSSTEERIFHCCQLHVMHRKY